MTKRTWSSFAIRLVVSGSVATLAIVPNAAQTPSPANALARTALFTEAQATRGEAVYRQSCASCHGAGLNGASGPSQQSYILYLKSSGDIRSRISDHLSRETLARF